MEAMNSHEQTIDTYLAAYGEQEPTTRRRQISECFAADAVLADPPAAAAGHDELDALFAAVQQQSLSTSSCAPACSTSTTTSPATPGP